MRVTLLQQTQRFREGELMDLTKMNRVELMNAIVGIALAAIVILGTTIGH